MWGAPWTTDRNTRDDLADADTIARCRELLSDEADGLSDEEMDLIRRPADAVALVIVEMFLEQRTAREYLNAPKWSDKSP
jgi:hypothetical protein